MKGVYFFPPRPNGDNRSVFEKYPELCKRMGFVNEVEAVGKRDNQRRLGISDDRQKDKKRTAFAQ